MGQNSKAGTEHGSAGLAGWLVGRLKARLRPGACNRPRLVLLERIALAQRQSVALVEADGRRFLVATSTEGAPAFYPLDERVRPASSRRGASVVPGTARLSW